MNKREILCQFKKTWLLLDKLFVMLESQNRVYSIFYFNLFQYYTIGGINFLNRLNYKRIND